MGSAADTRTSSDTKTRILQAARAEFAELGIAGARIDTIAAAASINKQRIYAYFGDKEHLFDAVLADAFERLADAVPLPRGRDELVAYAGRVHDFHQENPDFSRLLAWEALTFRASRLPGEEARQRYYATKVRTVSAAFPGADEDDVATLLLELIGVAAWPVLMSPLQRLLHGLPPETLPDRSAMRNAVLDAAEALVDRATGSSH